VPGLTGHDPWKQDEAYTFGIIRNMVASGDLVVPRVAADPFMEKPPAFYITVYRLGLIGHGFA
jgi:4-amino-4-deoxy-L-arabinose transferase-like glycosyltransferase